MLIKKLLKKMLDAPEPPTSEIDSFLRSFDDKNPERSASQRKAIAKAQRIAEGMK